MDGNILDWILFRSKTTAKQAETIAELDSEFSTDLNAYLGIDANIERLVYDIDGYTHLKEAAKSIVIPPNWSSTRQDIINGKILPNVFKRLDSQIKTDSNGKPIHGQQIHIHFHNGSALNLDGSWKHEPAKADEIIPNEAQLFLRNWGFKLPPSKK